MGRTVTLHRGGASITGILAGMRHVADLVADERLCSPAPEFTAGRITYTITIGTMPLEVQPDTCVVVHG